MTKPSEAMSNEIVSIEEPLTRDARAQLYDWVWQKIVDSAVPLFEGYKRLN